MGAAACTCARIDGCRPGRSATRVPRPTRECTPKAMVACPSECDAARLAARVGDWRDARFGSELLLRRVALADVTELGEDLRSVETTGKRERHHDLPIRKLLDVVFDSSSQLDD